MSSTAGTREYVLALYLAGLRRDRELQDLIGAVLDRHNRYRELARQDRRGHPHLTVCAHQSIHMNTKTCATVAPHLYPHLHQDRVNSSHICAGTGFAASTFALGLRKALATSALGLRSSHHICTRAALTASPSHRVHPKNAEVPSMRACARIVRFGCEFHASACSRVMQT